jgi:hypothetical protein
LGGGIETIKESEIEMKTQIILAALFLGALCGRAQTTNTFTVLNSGREIGGMRELQVSLSNKVVVILVAGMPKEMDEGLVEVSALEKRAAELNGVIPKERRRLAALNSERPKWAVDSRENNKYVEDLLSLNAKELELEQAQKDLKEMRKHRTKMHCIYTGRVFSGLGVWRFVK